MGFIKPQQYSPKIPLSSAYFVVFIDEMITLSTS